MNNNLTPFSSLTDEEILSRVFMVKERLSTLEIELAIRLEHALDQLREGPAITEQKMAALLEPKKV
jgi:hypothetical protein